MNAQKPYLESLYYVPDSSLTTQQREDLKRRLVVVIKGYKSEPDTVIKMYDESRSGFLGIPADYGLRKFKDVPFEDRTTKGVPFFTKEFSLPDPYHPSVENPAAQKKLMDEMEKAAKNNYCFLTCAPTGTGKTVCGLRTAAILRRKTLVIVPTNQIANQWIKAATTLLRFPPERIGRAQGDICQYRDRDIVVGTYQSLSKEGRYPEEFYRSFGTVIFDEVHRIGAEFFSQSAKLFPCTFRIGLSATIKRKDDGTALIYAHLGKVLAQSEADAMRCKVYVMRYHSKYHAEKIKSSTPNSVILRMLTNDVRRNNWMATIAKKLYSHGRVVLMVSDRVEHLHKMKAILVAQGIPSTEIGLYIGGVEQKELDRVARDARITLATYGMVKEGVDVRRWDSGIDMTPRSDATQLIGRVRRFLEGKKLPLWYTPVDTGIPQHLRMFKKRLNDYHSSKAEVEDNGKTYTG